MPTAPRRAASLLAGVLAMSASLLALGAVVWSDLAEASQLPAQAVESDQLAAPAPVTLRKFRYPGEEAPELLPELDVPRLKRRLAGRFEGY